MTNGLSHSYHLDVSIFVFRGIRSNFSFLFHFISFFDENNLSKQNSLRWDAVFLWLHIWGYSVCLCPIKRMPGLYGLRVTDCSVLFIVELSIHRGTISAIRRQELPEGDTASVISEDLREYDEEYGFKKAEIPGICLNDFQSIQQL